MLKTTLTPTEVLNKIYKVIKVKSHKLFEDILKNIYKDRNKK